MEKITSILMNKGMSYAYASDISFLLILAATIIGAILVIRIAIAWYRNPPEWDNIDWQLGFNFLIILVFVILVIYVILHFIIKYW